jgi:glycosyltransferase involved in cell wall biosynthesis
MSITINECFSFVTGCRSMRIGIDCQSFGPGIRHGFTTYLGNLLAALRRHFPECEFQEWSCHYHAGWRIPHQLWWDQGAIPWRAIRGGVDLIHAPAFSGAVCRTQPLVLTVHDLLYTRHPEWLPSGRARWYWGTWIPFTARHASAVIVPSAATKEDLITLAGVAPDRVTVVPHAIDPLFSQRPSNEAIRACRERYALTGPYVLYVGAIDRRKDWKGLLKAFSHLRKTHPSFRLVIAGHVSENRASDMDEAVRSVDETKTVRLIGHVPDQDLPILYAGAAMFVYPSWWEGFGLPPLEAMAMGVPVIAYNVASLPEVVGDAGILLDVSDTANAHTILAERMVRLAEDEMLRDELIEKGSRRAATFSWQHAAEQTMAVYQRCTTT